MARTGDCDSRARAGIAARTGDQTLGRGRAGPTGPREWLLVLAVGPGLDWWGSVGVKMPVRPGDHVVFPAAAGVWVEVEEERLLVCRVGQLLGVLAEIEEPREGQLPAIEEADA